MLRTFLVATVLLMTIHPLAAAEPEYIWGPDQRGLQSGARLLSATGNLQPGDPVVIEFVLKNTSDEKKVLVIQQYDDTYPTMGQDGRIELNILGSSQRRFQHELEPGEVLRKRQYRIAFSTEGLPEGQYHVTAGSAFWMTTEPNRGSGIPHRRPIPVVIGDPDKTALTKPEPAASAKDSIHWGGPVAGLMVGARLPEGKTRWKDGQRVQADIFLYNASDKEVSLDYEIPAVPADWNLHLEHESKQFVRLDSTWFTGAAPQIRAAVTIKPAETIQIMGLKRPVSTGGGDPVEQMVEGPAIELLKERTEFQYGDPKRLIGGKGKYVFKAAITVHRHDIPDLSIVLSAGGIPFEVNVDEPE